MLCCCWLFCQFVVIAVVYVLRIFCSLTSALFFLMMHPFYACARHNILKLSVLLSVTELWRWYFKNKWSNFNANWNKWSTGQWHEAFNVDGQEVKGQGHTRLKIHLEAWWMHHSYYWLQTCKMLAVYVQKSRTEDAGAVAESVRKKLKTGEKIDRTQHQLNAVDDSRTTSTEEIGRASCRERV